MKTEKALGLIMAELERAEKLHPYMPYDIVKACAVVSEEAGELVRACNNYDETKTGKRDIVTEAVQTAAVAIRFLKNLDDADVPDSQR